MELYLTLVSGGLFLVDSAIRHAGDGDEGLQGTREALRSFDPAALVALAALLLVWPFVFVGLKVSKLRGR